MDRASWAACVRRDSAALAAAATENLDVVVPSCPDWTMDKLLRHLGGVHSWVRGIVRDRLTASGPYEQPPDGADVPAWFLEQSSALLELLPHEDPGTKVWTWFAPDQTVGFWQRRMAHETSIHRWDGEAAVGPASPIETELAVDGIDEWLHVILRRRAQTLALPGTIHLHVTDAEGEWLLRPSEQGLVVSTGHAKGDAAIRGGASDLLLVLMHRKDLAAVEVFGDQRLVSGFLDKVHF